MPIRELSPEEESDIFGTAISPLQEPVSGAPLPPEMGSEPVGQAFDPSRDGEVVVSGNQIIQQPQPQQVLPRQPSKLRELSPEEYPALASKIREDVTAEPTWAQDKTNVARSILDGLVFGWSDEMGAGVAAAIASMMDGADYHDTYSDMLGLLQKERDDYDTRHPIASFAGNMVGGVLSPANVVAPAALGRVANMGKLVNGAPTRALPGVANALSNPVVRGASTGVLEGAVAGAGSARQGERMDGAAFGAGVGGALPFVTHGAAKALSPIWNRRITQELGGGDGFVPFFFADNASGNLQRLYRRVIGSTIGGGEKLRAQADRYTNRLRQEVERRGWRLGKSKNLAEEAVARAEKKAKKLSDAATEANKRAVKAAKAKSGVRQQALKEVYQEDAEMAAAKAASEADRLTQRAIGEWRETNMVAALPPEMPDNLVAPILGARNHNDADALLEKAWSEYGFKVVNDKNFRINNRQVAKSLTERLESDLLLSPKEKEGLAGMVDGAIEHLSDQSQSGWIAGKALNGLRSKLFARARELSKTDTGQTQAHMYRQLAEVLDDVVEKGLKGDDLAMFQRNRDAWGVNRVHRNAVGKASVEAGTRGAYTPNQWLQAVRDEGSPKLRRGEGKMQEEANAVAELIDRNNAMVKATAEATVANARDTLMRRERGEQRRLQQQIDRLNTKMDAEKRRAGANAASAERMYGRQSEIAVLEQRLQASKDALKMLEKLSPSDAVQNGITSWILTSMVGGAALGINVVDKIFSPLGVLAAPVAGGVLSNVLGSEGVQRALAGQTGVQKKLASGMERYSKTDGVVGRAAARAGVMSANTGE